MKTNIYQGRKISRINSLKTSFKSDKYLQMKLTLRNHHLILTCNDVIMGTLASQITSLPIVYSTVYSDADQRKHQGSASLAFVRGIHRWMVNSPHKWPVTRKMLPFDDVIIKSRYHLLSGNFKPISLLSSVSKVFEVIFFDQLYDYFVANSLSFKNQNGFPKHHSIELAALELTGKSSGIDQEKPPLSPKCCKDFP